MKVIFIARRSVDLGDSEWHRLSRYRRRRCGGDRPEEQQVFSGFFVEAVSFSFLFRTYISLGELLCTAG